MTSRKQHHLHAAGELRQRDRRAHHVTPAELLEPRLFFNGIAFVDGGTFPVGPSYATRTVATGDFNRDGKIDLVTTNHDDFSISILLGNGDGTFQPETDYNVAEANSVAVGDFNGDGNSDLVTANDNSTITILLGGGDGTFEIHAIWPVGVSWPDHASSVVVGDFNSDGKSDLAVTNIGSGTVVIVLGNGDGTFQARKSYVAGLGPSSVASGDFDRNGTTDLAITNESGTSPTVSILLGNGDGTFQPGVGYSTGAPPSSVVVGDFNADGNSDLATANAAGQFGVSVLLGRGDGTFRTRADYSFLGRATSIATGDFNGDGISDLAIVGRATFERVLLGLGDGTFLDRYSIGLITGSGLTLGDFNADGQTDLAFANTDSVAISLNAIPTVTTPAAVTPSPVTGVTADLSALGFDAAGESVLTYTWATTTLPDGATAPTFSANGTNAAKNTTVTFSQAGLYRFTVTINYAFNATATSSVDVTVDPTLTNITVSPAPTTVNCLQTQQFAATAFDQFGLPLANQPEFTWATSVGDITTAGLLTAPGASAVGIVTATSGSVSGNSELTITNSAPNDVELSSAAITENQPLGTVIGTLAASDPDAGQTFTYALVSGPESGGNGLFAVEGNQLKTNPANPNAAFDYETKTYYRVRIRATDQGGLSYEKSFVINVVDTPEPLVVNGTATNDSIALATNNNNLLVTINGATSTYNLAAQSSITVNGLAGNDVLTVGPGVPGFVAYGGEGNDTMTGGDGNDTIFGGTGDDLLYGGAGQDALRGEAGNDTIYGELGDDRLYGDKGFDVILGGDGNDRLDGGTGNDALYGGRNADYLAGMAGYDSLFGDDGKDTLLGGDQNDILYGGAGWDSLDGGAGDDSFFAIDATTYTDTVIGGDGYDIAHVDPTLDSVTDIESILYA